jgi:hypothetical protein
MTTTAAGNATAAAAWSHEAPAPVIRPAPNTARGRGPRRWYIYPQIVGGQPVERRLGKPYLPPGAQYFGCRQCHGLTYKSCQEHDGRGSALRRNPAKLNAMLDNFGGTSPGQLDPALKAIRPPPR